MKYLYTIFLIFLYACLSNEVSTEKRAENAIKPDRDIVVGVIDYYPNNLFTNGVKMAIEEINANGGVIGRKLKPLYYYDKNSISEARKIAEKIVANPDVVAVLGHNNTGIAISLAIIYKSHGINFISIGADLQRYGGSYIFRNSTTENELSLKIVEFAIRNGLKKIVVIYDRMPVGKRFSEIFQEHVGNNEGKIEVVAARFYSPDEKDYRLMIADIKRTLKFDSIFLAGDIPSAALIVKQIREMNIKEPILGTNLLDSRGLWMIAGKAAEGTIVPTAFDPKRAKNETQEFIKNFKKKFGLIPNSKSAIGYDSVHILAHSIEKGNSNAPVVVNTTMRFLDEWAGVTGDFTFNLNGNIKSDTIYFKKFTNGNFKFIKRELNAQSSETDMVDEITLKLPLIGNIETIDPGLTLDNSSIEITEQLFLGLTDFNPETYEVVPEMAEKWTVNKDSTKYNFTIRKDVKWTNGEPVTAHDIVWAIRRHISPDFECPYDYTLFILKNAKAIKDGNINDMQKLGVRAVDDYNIEFDLEYPASYFPSLPALWTYRPLPGKTIEKYGTQWTKPENIVSNGSYKLLEWKKGSIMILRKNPHFFDESKVSISDIRYYIIREN